jgi:hypothetical protein
MSPGPATCICLNYKIGFVWLLGLELNAGEGRFLGSIRERESRRICPLLKFRILAHSKTSEFLYSKLFLVLSQESFWFGFGNCLRYPTSFWKTDRLHSLPSNETLSSPIEIFSDKPYPPKP